MRTQDLFAFIHERWRIGVLKDAGVAKPWTEDSILQDYRFCNVFREWDTETRWIADNWRSPNEHDPDLWFAMMLARLVNWSPTLSDIGYPLPWRAARFVRIMRQRKGDGEKVWTGAYMVCTNGVSTPKIEYVANTVLSPAWRARAKVRPVVGETLEAFYYRLKRLWGLSSFMAAQVVADMKYAPVLIDAEDWWTFAAPGPGSLRGLNRVYGRQPRGKGGAGIFLVELLDLMEELAPLMQRAGMPRMHAQDLQNCLCEFDKYERVRLGQGSPRSRYNGRGD